MRYKATIFTLSILFLLFFTSVGFAQIEAVYLERISRTGFQGIILRKDGLRYFVDFGACAPILLNEFQYIYLESRNGVIDIGTRVYFKNNNTQCTIFDIRPAR
jgi:hypothetical protein